MNTNGTPPTKPGEDQRYDVIILGSGIAGSMLGAILARQGAKVLLVDAASHPRFAIGESTIPYTLVAMQTLARRYDVPEIAALANFPAATKKIAHSFGVKKHFGFLLHHDGEEQNPREVNQFNTPKALHQSSHYFRQDTDAYLFHAAIRYGCDARQNCRIDSVDLRDDGVTAVAADGSRFEGRFIVDGSGFRSPIAATLGLRDEPCVYDHHSRSIFTHMVGVKTTDSVTHHPDNQRPPLPWHEGTVHHMFERGWFWVIPFDNNDNSSNPLCSVGLTLDPRRYPKREDLTPEQEFRLHAERFPVVARQFEGARSVREWVSTGRLQYSSHATTGARYCLLAHAAAFIDPLFSRGMSNSVEVVNALAWRILEAVEDDEFTADRFEYVDRLQEGLLAYNDSLVNSAFISFADYDLWNAVFRIWAFGTLPGTLRLHKAIREGTATGSDQPYRDIEESENLGLWWPDHKGYNEMYDTMVELCKKVERGEVPAREAAARLHRDLEEAEWIPPHIGFNRREVRFLNPTPRKLLGTVRWVLRDAPPDIRELAVGTVKDAARARLRGEKVF